MTLDAGVTNNSFSLTISIPSVKGRVTPLPRQNSQGYANKPKKPAPVGKEMVLNAEMGDARCQALLTIEVMPPKGGRIHFGKMYKEVIVPLLKPFNVAVCVTDRWNSILLLDQLRDDHGIVTFQYSLRYKDFEAIRSYMEGGMLKLPKPEMQGDSPGDIVQKVQTFDQQEYPKCFDGRPVDHLILQFLTVQDTGRSVDKGPNLTDDSFRTVALAMHYMRDIEFVRTYLAGNARERSEGLGLVAAPGSGDQTQQSYGMSSDAKRAVVAMPGGGGSDSSNVFARSRQ